ncbi:MAG: hypothetical protein AAGD22_06405 [Verrucomicrobiota bacterium]
MLGRSPVPGRLERRSRLLGREGRLLVGGFDGRRPRDWSPVLGRVVGMDGRVVGLEGRVEGLMLRLGRELPLLEGRLMLGVEGRVEGSLEPVLIEGREVDGRE